MFSEEDAVVCGLHLEPLRRDSCHCCEGTHKPLEAGSGRGGQCISPPHGMGHLPPAGLPAWERERERERERDRERESERGRSVCVCERENLFV